eukprot:1439840-Pleurochrysis_carterae.AAC.1
MPITVQQYEDGVLQRVEVWREWQDGGDGGGDGAGGDVLAGAGAVLSTLKQTCPPLSTTNPCSTAKPYTCLIAPVNH